jgi:DNA-directed RNA polymerase specialized sigma24 family protein
MPEPKPSARHSFPATQWTMVEQAGGAGEGRQQALTLLLEQYLPPLRVHLIAGRGLKREAAEDLLQDFVLNKVLERNLIQQANRDRGKFRTFLLTCLDRYAINHRRDARRARRSPAEQAHLHIDEQIDPPAVASSATRAFEVAWARQVILRALRQMQDECQRSGRTDLWALFNGRVVAPAFDGVDPWSYDQIVRECGFVSPVQASNALVTAKRAFVRHLRAVVGEYAADEQEIEEEIRDLKMVLATE